MDIGRIIPLCGDKVMALMDLQEDPCFSRVSADMMDSFISTNLDIAVNAALELRKKFPDKSPIDIAKEKGAIVNIIDREFRVMKVQYRSEIYFEGREINIVKPSIKLMHEQLKSYIDLSLEKLIEIHVAHELYHLIEYLENRATPDLLPEVVTLRILKYEKKTKILKSSEVAAHAFSKELLKLPFNPKLLDYLYLIQINEIYEEDFIKHLIKLNKIMYNVH